MPPWIGSSCRARPGITTATTVLTLALLLSAGRPVPVNDLWIAAATIDAGAHLLTYDHDFGRIGGLNATILTA